MGAHVWHCVCVPVTSFLFQHLVWNMYIHQYMYICQHGFQTLVHPFCIVTKKHGFPCVSHCLCSSQSTSVPMPCLECVHATVHVFVLTWLPMLAEPPMDSYMETWVPIGGTVCMSQSPCLWSYILTKVCICISTCIQVHLTYHVCFTPLE